MPTSPKPSSRAFTPPTLANTLGNLLQRTMAMAHRYRAGVVPPGACDDRGPTSEKARAVPESLETMAGRLPVLIKMLTVEESVSLSRSYPAITAPTMTARSARAESGVAITLSITTPLTFA